MRALLVEMDPVIAQAVGRQLLLAGIGFERRSPDDLDDIPEGVEAVILGNVRQPERLLRELRERGLAGAIICLIDRRCARTTATLLYAGADDVMVKPVAGVEIHARIDVVRRRLHGRLGRSVREGMLVVPLDGGDPEIGGVRIHLSQREQAILAVLALHRNQIVAKERIYESVYGTEDYDPVDKVIDVYICKLRKKISEATGGAKYIETVYGRGYKLAAPPNHQADASEVISLLDGSELADRSAA